MGCKVSKAITKGKNVSLEEQSLLNSTNWFE